MFNTFLKPVHEHLDEKGYFAPIPDAEAHMAQEELGPHRVAVKRIFVVALCVAAIAVMTVVFVSLFGDIISRAQSLG